MHVLIYTHEFPPFLGGAGVYCHELARGLSQLGVRVTVLTRSYGESDTLIDSALEFRVVRMPGLAGLSGYRPRKRDVGSLLRALRRQRPDFLLIGEAAAQQVAAHARLRRGLRYAVTLHGSEIPRLLGRVHGWRDYLRWRRARSLYLNASHVIAVSNYTARLFWGYLPSAREKVRVVPHGVDENCYAPKPSSASRGLRSMLGLEGKKVILSISRLVPNKGQEILIRALPEVSREIPSVFLLVGGDGPHRGHLMRTADKLGLAKHVGFLGPVPKNLTPEYYRMCDLFALVSNFESFGIVYLEASACGKAVLGANSGGVSEAVVPGLNGELVRPGAVGETATKMIMLLSDDERRRDLGLQGRQLVLDAFTLGHMASNTLQVLRS